MAAGVAAMNILVAEQVSLDPVGSGGVGPIACPRDEDWFTSLYDETFDTVYHLARALVSDPDIAQDIVAETYLRVWRSRERFHGDGSILSWVMAITHNCAMDHLRARRPKISLDVFDSIGEPEGPDSPAAGLSECDAEAIRRLVAKLGSDQRLVIFMRFYLELPHDAIAARMGKSSTAVRQIQFRALIRLRKLLLEGTPGGA